jgi:hypothetical protein
MKFCFMFLVAILGASAMAYNPGTYTCKNSDAALPPDTTKITDVDMAGTTLPVVEVTKHYREDMGNPKSQMVTTVIKGIAAVSASGTTEVFMVGNGMRFEFDNNVLFGCTAP